MKMKRKVVWFEAKTSDITKKLIFFKNIYARNYICIIVILQTIMKVVECENGFKMPQIEGYKNKGFLLFFFFESIVWINANQHDNIFLGSLRSYFILFSHTSAPFIHLRKKKKVIGKVTLLPRETDKGSFLYLVQLRCFKSFFVRFNKFLNRNSLIYL